MRDALQSLMCRARPMLALTGAGLSAAAGIPTYRSHSGEWLRSKPVLANEFARSPAARRRYWQRSLLGYPAFAAARATSGHASLAALQRSGWLSGVVTQNVDELHEQAGSTGVVHLHGRLRQAQCVSCQALYPRDELQAWLEVANPHWQAQRFTVLADGDADPGDVLDDAFRVPDCSLCGGVLKPQVVFFGDNVPGTTWHAVDSLLDRSAGLLVVGTSLAVFSGYRVLRDAVRRGLPVAMLNLGSTRGDAFAEVLWREDCEAGLGDLLCSLDGSP